MKKNCWKQIEKCNNRFAAHDVHEGYPDSTAALLIMMIQIKFPLRLVSISLHPTVREISKKITFTCHFRHPQPASYAGLVGSLWQPPRLYKLLVSSTLIQPVISSPLYPVIQAGGVPVISYRKVLPWEKLSPGRWCTPPCSRPSRSRWAYGSPPGSGKSESLCPKRSSRAWPDTGQQFKTASGLLSEQGELWLPASAPSSDAASQAHALLRCLTPAHPLWSAAEHLLYPLSLDVRSLGSGLKI